MLQAFPIDFFNAADFSCLKIRKLVSPFDIGLNNIVAYLKIGLTRFVSSVRNEFKNTWFISQFRKIGIQMFALKADFV